jgi:hypothetical protein
MTAIIEARAHTRLSDLCGVALKPPLKQKQRPTLIGSSTHTVTQHIITAIVNLLPATINTAVRSSACYSYGSVAKNITPRWETMTASLVYL